MRTILHSWNVLWTTVAIAFVLQACGEGGYWELKHAPVLVKQIVKVDYPPCGISNARGCWIPTTQTIEIKAGLSASDEACVLRHEKAHAAGWVHPPGQALEWDCGPREYMEAACAS